MNESIADNLVITVAKTGGLELPAEILEFSIDQAIDEGILKDIPFVGWIAKGFSVGMNISDRILHHKILRFLFALEAANEGDLRKFRTKVDADPEFRRKIGEHLVLMLDKVDAFDKANLLAVVFDHFLTGDIEHEHFIDLAHVIDRSTLADLRALGVPDNQRMTFTSTGLAAASGILEFGIAEPEVAEELPQLGARLSRFGRDLRDVFLGRYRTRAEDEKKQRERLWSLFSDQGPQKTNKAQIQE